MFTTDLLHLLPAPSLATSPPQTFTKLLVVSSPLPPSAELEAEAALLKMSAQGRNKRRASRSVGDLPPPLRSPGDDVGPALRSPGDDVGPAASAARSSDGLLGLMALATSSSAHNVRPEPAPLSPSAGSSAHNVRPELAPPSPPAGSSAHNVCPEPAPLSPPAGQQQPSKRAKQEFITIVLRDRLGGEVYVQLLPNTKFAKVFQAYCGIKSEQSGSFSQLEATNLAILTDFMLFMQVSLLIRRNSCLMPNMWTVNTLPRCLRCLTAMWWMSSFIRPGRLDSGRRSPHPSPPLYPPPPLHPPPSSIPAIGSFSASPLPTSSQLLTSRPSSFRPEGLPLPLLRCWFPKPAGSLPSLMTLLPPGTNTALSNRWIKTLEDRA